MQKLMRRGGRVAVGGVLTGAILMAMTISGPAGASTTPAKNHIIVGSGSSTTYDMMQGLDTLFNDSLGCYMTQPSTLSQTLNFSCDLPGNNGGLQVGKGYTENPINDVAVEEPALGSSAGIAQIEYGGRGNDGNPGIGGKPLPTAVVNYARSSRQFKDPGDYPGLNFVAYATDGVSWLSFPKVNGKATPSSKVKNLTTTQLTEIWSGKITNWGQVGGTKGRICVYVANLSSGTVSTWATALGFTSTTTLAAYVNGLTKTPAGCKSPKGETYAESHASLPENEGQDVVKNGDEANSIFFFSYGKYQVLCAKTRTAQCDNNLGPTTTPYLGKVNGVAPTAATILCTGSCTTAFPITRDLFNVYSNGSFSPKVNKQFGFPAATAATINYVSEIGYLCKPQTDTKKAHVIDPSTGTWYHREIANVIGAQGFIPFPLQTKGQDINSVDTPASALLKAIGDKTYSPNDPVVGKGTTGNEKVSNPAGYCQVWTTDGNTAP